MAKKKYVAQLRFVNDFDSTNPQPTYKYGYQAPVNLSHLHDIHPANYLKAPIIKPKVIVKPPIIQPKQNIFQKLGTGISNIFNTPRKPLDMMGGGVGKSGMTQLSAVSKLKPVAVGRTGVKITPRAYSSADALITSALDSASLGIVNGGLNKLTGNKGDMSVKGHETAYGVGKLLGYALPYGKASKALNPLINAIKKPLLKGVARVAEGSTVLGGGGVIEDVANGKSKAEIIKNLKTNALMGGGFGLVGEALPLIGKGIKNLKERPQNIQNAFTSKFGELPSNAKIAQPQGLKGSFKRPQTPNTIAETKFNNTQSKLKTLMTNNKTPGIEPTSNIKITGTNIPIVNQLAPKIPNLSGGNGKSKFANVTLEDSANSAEQFKKDLKELDLGYDKVTNENSLIQANKRINDDLEGSVRYVLNNKEVGSAEHTTTAIQLINKFQKDGNYERAIDIASDISSKLTKNGQAIQAASIYDRLSPEGILLYAQRQVTKLNDARWFKGLTKEQKINPELAKRLQELSNNMKNLTGDAKVEASQELQQALQALGKSTGWRKAESGQTIAQLLNTKTMDRNIIGNELFYRLERFNKYVATPIDMARSTLTSKARTVTLKTGNSTWSRFFTGKAEGGVKQGIKSALYSPYVEGLVKGTKAGWKGVNPGGLQTQYDLTAPAFSGKWNPMTYLEKTLGATLKGFDYAAYTRAVNQTVGEMGELAAINSKLVGSARKIHAQEFVNTASKNILDIADQYGKYVTFQDSNVLSNSLSGIKKFMNAGKDFGIGSLVIKYPKTPGAIIMRGLDYSAAGFLKSAYQVAKPLMTGKPMDTREATMALSRGITGTLGFTGLGYFLADKGVITGRTNKDKDVREMEKQTGGGSYKVNLTALQRWATSGFDTKELQLQDNDTMFSYDWAQPIAMAISFGANINSNLKENKGALNSTAATLASSLEGSISTVAEQPVLQGVTRLFQGYDLGQNITNTAKGILSSFTPTMLNQIRQKQDNTGRNTYDPDPIKQSLNMAKVKLPNLPFIKKLPAAYNTDGTQKENFQNGSNNAFNVFLNPGFVSKNIPTPVQKEILRIFDKTGDKTHFPSVVPKSIRATGSNPLINLNGQEMSDYQKIIGEKTITNYKYIMDTTEYKLKTDSQKSAMLSKAMADAKENAKIEMLRKLGK